MKERTKLNRTYKNSEEAINEVKKFVEFCGGYRKAAEMSDININTLYYFASNKRLIKDYHAYIIEKVSNGLCSSVLLLKKDSSFHPDCPTFTKFVYKNYLKSRLDASGLSADDLFNYAFSNEFEELILNETKLDVKMAPYFCAVFGGNLNYWIDIISFYKKKNNC